MGWQLFNEKGAPVVANNGVWKTALIHTDVDGSGTEGLFFQDGSGPVAKLYPYADGSVEFDLGTAGAGGSFYWQYGDALFLGQDFLAGATGNPRKFSVVDILNTGAGIAPYSTVFFANQIKATDLLPTDGVVTLNLAMDYGAGGVAAKGTGGPLNVVQTISGSGSASSEPALYVNRQVVNIGTGYTQSAGPVGRLWFADNQVDGPLAVQPATMNGPVQLINNHYNGGAADSPMAATWLATLKGVGASDAAHLAADTYPVAVGLGIVGYSRASAVDGIGFTTALQIGGFGSPWGETKSLVGTGIDISQYATAGINIHAASAVAAPSIIFDTFLQTGEMASAPSAPAANGVRIYAVDNGGKTELLALFNSGSAVRLAIQP